MIAINMFFFHIYVFVLFVAACTIVVVQVMMSAVDFMKKDVPFVYPPRAYH